MSKEPLPQQYRNEQKTSWLKTICDFFFHTFFPCNNTKSTMVI